MARTGRPVHTTGCGNRYNLSQLIREEAQTECAFQNLLRNQNKAAKNKTSGEHCQCWSFKQRSYGQAILHLHRIFRFGKIISKILSSATAPGGCAITYSQQSRNGGKASLGLMEYTLLPPDHGTGSGLKTHKDQVLRPESSSSGFSHE
ncbi:hypothetical protein CB1_000598010 [Camelus ferus]|nr:hypothetical protein CB1_000598010 [Camelus ferus]